eukprot:1291236-Rhodomonas_salina.1
MKVRLTVRPVSVPYRMVPPSAGCHSAAFSTSLLIVRSRTRCSECAVAVFAPCCTKRYSSSPRRKRPEVTGRMSRPP